MPADGIARSTFYNPPAKSIDDTAPVERMASISDSFEIYGYHRMQAELRLTDGDYDLPIFSNVARDIVPGGSDQLWVADITYVAIPTGFVYVTVILDA